MSAAQTPSNPPQQASRARPVSLLALGSAVCALVIAVVGAGTVTPAHSQESGVPGLGVDRGPEQPINFSHRIHAGEYGIECQYCHNVADKSYTAGIPAVEVCMGCHVMVKTESEEIQKIHQYWAEGEEIPWIRVHNLADHVQFNHQPHIQAGVACQDCHGPVQEMDRIYQVNSLQMGWCLSCHTTPRHPEDIAEIHESVDPEMVGERQPHGFYRQYIETFYGEERATRDCGACHY